MAKEEEEESKASASANWSIAATIISGMVLLSGLCAWFGWLHLR